MKNFKRVFSCICALLCFLCLGLTAACNGTQDTTQNYIVHDDQDIDNECTEHHYDTTVVEPTCQEEGYTLHRCSICGDSYKTDETQTVNHKGVWTCEFCSMNYFNDLKNFLVSNGRNSDQIYTVEVDLTQILNVGKPATLLLNYHNQGNLLEIKILYGNPQDSFSVQIPSTYTDRLDYTYYSYLLGGITFQGKLSASGLNNSSSLTYTYTNLSDTYSSMIPTYMKSASSLGRICVSSASVVLILLNKAYSASNFGFTGM